MASAKPDFALPLQTVLHARYLLGDTLGGGALGITYRAVQLDAPARGRVVAVKEFFPRALAVRPADFAALESALYGSKIPHFAFRIPNWCARK